jgi:drug/metabolite transporter (DMT)-like permease
VIGSFAVILSGLAAALTWGLGDFAGGLASRRAAAMKVVLVSQPAGVVAMAALGLMLRQPAPSRVDLLWGAAAGLVGGVGLLLLYLSLAQGKMGVAAPLTAIASGGIPLMVGLLTEGLPGPTQIGGFLLTVPALWLISRPDEAGNFRPRDALVPLLAGVGFGGFMALIGQVDEDAGFVWPLVATRLASLALLIPVWLVGNARSRARGTAGSDSAAVAPFPWTLAVLAGLGDTAGNAFYALAVQTGRLDVAAVLGALDPAATVLLARLVLDERLTLQQSVGVGLALGAVALIAL